jgi:hypothetical protein
LNANVHFHTLVLDGVFSRPTPGAAPVFHPLPAPTDEEIVQILEQIHERVTRLLRRGGRLPEDPSPPDPVAEQMPLLAGYAAASHLLRFHGVLAPRGVVTLCILSSNIWNLEVVSIADATPWATVATPHHVLCGGANGVCVQRLRIDLPGGTR